MKRKDFAFMERFEVPHLDKPERTYLSRLRIVQTPWFALYLHRLDTADSRPTLHDHPWSFVSFILRGGYNEIRLDPHTLKNRRRFVRLINVMHLGDAHYIETLHRTPTWTLLLVGPRRRTWGYWRRVSESSRGNPQELTDRTEYPARRSKPETILRGVIGAPGRGQWYWTPFDRDEHADEFDAAMAKRNEAR